MVHRDRLIEHLNEHLEIDQFQDYCINGLQIEGKSNIDRIVMGVSISARFLTAARKAGADMIIVHHGLFWKNTPHPLALTGLLYKRIKIILESDINLVAYHLPLDAHPTLGNNVQIKNKLFLDTAHAWDIGQIGSYNTPIHTLDFKERLDSILPDPARHLPYGPNKIKKVGIISGAASHDLERIAQSKIDAFVTGDISEPSVRIAEELGIHYFIAGHYNTERFGPMALGQYIEEHFDVSVKFIDIENPF